MVSLALTIVNNVWNLVIYRLRSADDIMGSEPIEQITNEHGELVDVQAQDSNQKMKRIMSLPRTWFVAAFLLAYVGLVSTIVR